MIKKLDRHQERVENLFKVYYDTLDDLRCKYLNQEYQLRQSMDSFEQ